MIARDHHLASLVTAVAAGVLVALVAPAATAAPAASAAPVLPARKPAMTPCCAILELRQYTTYPGKRDALIGLFERELVESQEATGIQLVGQFRDVNDPDRFVWLRGFADMPARKQALTDFYFGPIWKAHRDAANATLYDNDNVLLLHPAPGTTGFALAGLSRPPPGPPAAAPGFVVITVYAFAQPVRDDFVRWFATTLRPLLTRTGAAPLAELVSDPSENTFPRLPVREGEHVFAWVAQFSSRRAYDDHLARLAADAAWSGTWFAALHKQLARPPERIMLEPTPRSRIGHADRAAPIAR